ncbi:MAG TPA: family 78 glycoside hydrolase catalytic domain [Bacteroidales bacterium]|nr:family 78 glycoside hydrolase catalytic domain [Bacteroidales bacterium]
MMCRIAGKVTFKDVFIKTWAALIVSAYIALLFNSCADKLNNNLLYDLKCENLVNPLGIGSNRPGFSWKIKSDRNGTQQKAYQILVASDSALLNEETADLWNPGKIRSSESVLVIYEGKELKSGSEGFWKVRMWDEKGSVSAWSDVAGFTTGLLDNEDWNADYIGFIGEGSVDCSPLLRSEFKLTKPFERLLLYVNSLGYHEVYVNGRKVGDDVLSPAVSQFDKRSHSITYDVSSFVKEGDNDLVLWLGRGWYSKGLPGVVADGPLVRARLEKLSAGQRETILVTNNNWKGRVSGYSTLGSWKPDKFGGEIVNGGQLLSDWSHEYINSLEWLPVSVVTVPEHKVSPQMTEPNRIIASFSPDTITANQDGTYLVDMGRNLTGWLKIEFGSLKKGQEIIMEYCDHLNPGGKFIDRNQKDIYIAAGEGTETFINKFNYHGFRYVRISNLNKKPSKKSVTAYLIHTDYSMASSFECSDPEMNSIHDMIRYTLQCLSLGGYIVDCPQIERLGYGGDGNASTETAQMMFDLGPLYSNWLQAWSDCNREDGGMPHTAPNPYRAGGGPYWCGFIISASWKTYLAYGDKRILEKHYPVMQNWLRYVEEYSSSGILKKWPDTDYRSWYLGDWATPEGIDQTSEESVDLVNNSFVCMCYGYMQKIAHVLGKKDDIRAYAQKESELKKKVHELFYDNEKGIYAKGYQIDQSFPMLAGIVPDSLVERVRKNLYYETEINRNGHIACGLVGIPVLTEWAVAAHAPDLIHTMLKKRNYPGYLYMIDKGATTTWEHWNGARSHIHNCYNGIGIWFYQAVGGIQMVKDFPAYRRVLIDPQIPEGISWAKTTKDTPYGTLKVDWESRGNELKLELVVPVGVSTEVIIPDYAQKYILNGKEAKVRKNGNKVETGSGTHSLVFI